MRFAFLLTIISFVCRLPVSDSLRCPPRSFLSTGNRVNLPVQSLAAASDKEDAELELQMAKELFDDLKGADPHLSVKAFLQWDDIQDLLIDEVLDESDLKAIVAQVDERGSGVLGFNQFRELVDLVNEVSILMQSEYEEDEEEYDEGDKADNADGANDTAALLRDIMQRK